MGQYMTFKHWNCGIYKRKIVRRNSNANANGGGPFMSGWGRGTVYRLWCRANPIQRHQWAKYNYLPLAEANQPEFSHFASFPQSWNWNYTASYTHTENYLKLFSLDIRICLVEPRLVGCWLNQGWAKVTFCDQKVEFAYSPTTKCNFPLSSCHQPGID